jgi:hypothetical protein
LQAGLPRVIVTHKARGPDRRKWNSRQDWGLKSPEKFVERRQQVERRMPDVVDGSLAEFKRLTLSLTAKREREPEDARAEPGSVAEPSGD